MTDSVRLKPCPFCGDYAQMDGSCSEDDYGSIINTSEVSCGSSDCGTRGPQIKHDDVESPQAADALAADAWNTRAAQPFWQPIESMPDEWKDGRPLDVIYWYLSVKVLKDGPRYPRKRQVDCYFKDGELCWSGRPLTWYGQPTHVMLPLPLPKAPS